jgi:hypothetical protein
MHLLIYIYSFAIRCPWLTYITKMVPNLLTIPIMYLKQCRSTTKIQTCQIPKPGISTHKVSSVSYLSDCPWSLSVHGCVWTSGKGKLARQFIIQRLCVCLCIQWLDVYSLQHNTSIIDSISYPIASIFNYC